MRESGKPNAGMRVASSTKVVENQCNFKPCISAIPGSFWVGYASLANNAAGGRLNPQVQQGDFQALNTVIYIQRQVASQGAFTALFLKPPIHYTFTVPSSTAPGLRQISLLDRQLAGRLKETPEGYIFVKSSIAVSTAEAILKDLLKLLKVQAELLKNSDDLTIRYYDADDVAYPVEGGISFVEHSDFAWVQKQLRRKDGEFNIGRLNERTLY